MKKRKPTAPKSTESALSSEKIEEKVRRRAYELYELRGNEDGHDVADWLTAEAEIACAKPKP